MDDVTEGKLDSIASQVTDLRILVAEVAGDTRTILARLAHIDTRDADHEARLRYLESLGLSHLPARVAALEGHDTADHDARLKALETTRAQLVGAAAVLTLIGGSAGALAAKLLHLLG